jgi:4-amino-4-deoxy-L-arabinose transferase-like glycosyltransferase
MSDGASAERREALAVAALTVLPLLPFLGKAFSIDAPVFVAVAEQIARAPLDPFGFEMHWDATSLAAAEFNRNPPLLSYWIAPWLALSGGAEWPVRLACLPFPLLASLSFLGIARRLGGDAFGATALLVATPAFLVLASSLLLDVPLLGCLLFAVYALLRGAEPGGEAWLWAAGTAAGAAALMKYAGLAALPLVAAGTWLLAGPRPAALARVLLPGVILLGAWGGLTAAQYGAVHFLGSTDVVVQRHRSAPWLVGQLTAVPIYYGAALVFPVAIWLRTVAGRGRGIGLAAVALTLGLAVALLVLPWAAPARRGPPGPEELAIAALGFAGGLFLWLLLLDPRGWWPTPLDRFLALWLAGWIVFSGLVNWHVNAADALVAAPPALLLLFRHPWLRPTPRFARVAAAASFGLAFLLAWADTQQADFHRTVAAEIAARVRPGEGARWMVGTWGFQHYVGRRGFSPVLPASLGRPEIGAGDWIAAPRNVAQQDVAAFRDRYRLELVARWENRSWLPLRTTNPDAVAGFYSHRMGYAPFAFSTLPIEAVELMRVRSLVDPR